MPEIVESNTSFEEIDANREGNVDEREFRQWVSNNEGRTSSTYERSSTTLHRHDNVGGQVNRSGYETLSSTTYVDGYNTGRAQYISQYAQDNLATVSDYTHETAIETHSEEETSRYLERQINICKDPHPSIIRRKGPGKSITQQQRVLVRYLQPPPLPAPGPLIIKEVREPQPAPLPPLIIRQVAISGTAPPPLYLRERPPLPPPVIPSETIIRRVPGPPPPPRSVIIERYEATAPKPRDIIIERWLPYGPLPERQTIVERAPPIDPVKCSECHNQIIIYESNDAHITRRIEREGVVIEDPAHYRARYGDTLLDSTTLIETARSAGVIEDLSVAAVSYSNVYSGSNYITSTTTRRRGLFDFFQYGLLPSDYTPGARIYRRFVRPAHFTFPSSSLWSVRTGKYREEITDGRITRVTLELIEDGVTVYTRTITKEEYKRAQVTSSAPKLAWNDFLQVLQVFMVGSKQEQDADIARAFDILDQGRRGLFERSTSLSDGLISPDELRAFLSILTDDYRVDLCVFLADTDGSGQISLSEFTRMVKSGLARDIICDVV